MNRSSEALENTAIPVAEPGPARTSGRPLEVILTAAAECFRENGFAATSIDDVARSLGATKGMVYHHFRSKTDLFFAVYRRGMELNFAASRPHLQGPGTALKRLTRMSVSHSVAMMEHQAFQRVLAQGVTMHLQGATTAAQRDTLRELIEIRDAYETMFRKAIAQAACEEGFVVRDLSLASKSFLAVLNGSVYWYSPRDSDEHGERIALARELVAYALRGLGADVPEELSAKRGTR